MTTSAIDVLGPLAQIVGQIAPIGAIGAAMLLTAVALFSFEKLRRMVDGGAVDSPAAALLDDGDADNIMDGEYAEFLAEDAAEEAAAQWAIQEDFWNGGFEDFGWSAGPDVDVAADMDEDAGGGIMLHCSACSTSFRFPHEDFDPVEDGQCPDCGAWALYSEDEARAIDGDDEAYSDEDEDDGSMEDVGDLGVCPACSTLYDLSDASLEDGPDGQVWAVCPACGDLHPVAEAYDAAHASSMG